MRGHVGDESDGGRGQIGVTWCTGSKEWHAVLLRGKLQHFKQGVKMISVTLFKDVSLAPRGELENEPVRPGVGAEGPHRRRVGSGHVVGLGPGGFCVGRVESRGLLDLRPCHWDQ